MGIGSPRRGYEEVRIGSRKVREFRGALLACMRLYIGPTINYLDQLHFGIDSYFFLVGRYSSVYIRCNIRVPIT